MALTDQPYLPLYVDDWMNNTKLKMCSPSAHGLMVSIMCIMHKSENYGIILLKQKFKQSDNQNKNFALQIAKLSSFDLLEIENPFYELLNENVIRIEGEFLICDRMVKDSNISKSRSLSGKKGGISTQKTIKNFAKPKVKANTVNENVNEIENVNEVKKEKKEEIPNFLEFQNYANSQKQNIDQFHLKSKYESWVEANWKDGNGTKIKNWKTKLKNTIPYLKIQSKENEPIVAGRQTMTTIQKNLDATGLYVPGQKTN